MLPSFISSPPLSTHLYHTIAFISFPFPHSLNIPHSPSPAPSLSLAPAPPPSSSQPHLISSSSTFLFYPSSPSLSSSQLLSSTIHITRSPPISPPLSWCTLGWGRELMHSCTSSPAGDSSFLWAGQTDTWMALKDNSYPYLLPGMGYPILPNQIHTQLRSHARAS